MRKLRLPSGNGCFGRYGSVLSAASDADLFGKLEEIVGPAPRGIDGRTSDHRELDCLARYLRLLRNEGLLEELSVAPPACSGSGR